MTWQALSISPHHDVADDDDERGEVQTSADEARHRRRAVLLLAPVPVHVAPIVVDVKVIQEITRRHVGDAHDPLAVMAQVEIESKT